MNKTVLALAALASASIAVPAFAAPASTSVRTSDLNLATVAGRETLSRRISFAAETICIVPGDRSLISMAEGKKCYDRAVSAAQQQVASISRGVLVASN